MLNLDKVRKIKKGLFGLTTPQYDYSNGSFVLNQNWKDRLNSWFLLDAFNLPNSYMNGSQEAKPLNNQYSGLISLDILNNIMQSKNISTGPYSGYTLTGNTLTNLMSNFAFKVNPLFGIGMKGASLLGNTIGNLGGNTDGMTKVDAIFNTGLANTLTLGLNGFLGKKTLDFSVNEQTAERVGRSYGGTMSDINDAASKAGKKYGLFSSKQRKQDDNLISDARIKLQKMTNISDEAYDMQSIASNMSDLNHIKYSLNLNGGLDSRYLRAAKKGDKILRIKKLLLHKVGGVIKLSINVNTKQIEEWSPTITECFEEDTIKLLNGGTVSKQARDFYKNYNLDNVIVIKDSNPRTEDNTIYINTDEDEIHELWHYLSNNKPNENLRLFYENLNDDKIKLLGGDLEFINRMGDPGIFYHPSEIEARLNAAKFKTIGLSYTKEFFKNLRNNENQYGYNMRDLLHMYNDENLEKLFNMKNGGTIEWQPTIEIMKEGGKTEELESPKIEETNLKNIIPEGALHARKHNMENAENLTKKGIPVIDNDGELLAEIEKNEIIFTLEVTKKLEELMKDGSDEAAIEAGKLLVKEILFNTNDRTGLIGTLGKGGVIDVVS